MRAYAIVDLQYGSTGKGALAGYLAKRWGPDTVMSAFGPNSGHTFIDADGRKHVNIMLPNGIVGPNVRTVMIGPGALINAPLMWGEIERYRGLGYIPDIVIHENACVVQARHQEAEADLGSIGSTQKGTGAALQQKISRKGSIIARDALKGTPLEGLVVSVPEYNDILDRAKCVQIEGCQGFSLSINQGFYPYVTSRDCTFAQLMADVAYPRRSLQQEPRMVECYGVARTFPIRVNNKTGTSGPGYHDQEEISFADLGLEPELTTVTKLPRRIFTYSREQIRQAIRMNGCQGVFLNFCNYFRGNNAKVDEIIQWIAEDTATPVRWLGYGATENDIIDSLLFAQYRQRRV